MSMQGAHQSIMRGVAAVLPNPPKWFGAVATITGLAAGAADWRISARMQRPLPPDDTAAMLRDYYREAREKYAREAAADPPPADPPTADPPQESRYLREEGHDTDTDCFSCASAHLAAQEGSLEMAAEAAGNGSCGPECQEWVALAVEEPAALFSRDWTPERREKWPPEQREVVDRYSPRIRRVMREVIDGPAVDQRLAIVEAAGDLNEAIRFTNAGDPLSHPEVDWRLRRAESRLATAERLDPTVFGPEVGTDLRHLRQDVGSKVSTPEDIADVGRRARTLAQQANAPAVSALTGDKLRAAAAEVAALRADFRADRLRLGGATPPATAAGVA